MSTRTTVRLRDDLKRKAKRFAAERNLPFTALLEEALPAYLGPLPVRRRKSRTRLPVCGDPTRKLSREEYLKRVKEMEDDDSRRFIALNK